MGDGHPPKIKRPGVRVTVGKAEDAVSKASRKTTRKAGAGKKKGARKKSGVKKASRKKRARPIAAARRTQAKAGAWTSPDEILRDWLTRVADGFSDGIGKRVQDLGTQAGELPAKLGREVGRFLLSPQNPKLASQAGSYLRELRELAGLTIQEVSEAIDVRDQSILRAVENGTASLSFELILRLAAIFARHDPLPFVMRFTRTYNPELWELLESWGVGRIPLQFEREREFINIYRRHDAARKLTEDGFEKVLDFTRAAFEMSLHFVAMEEQVEDQEVGLEEELDEAR